jgi:hypothetical protein
MPEDDEKDQQITRLNNDLAEMRKKLRTAETRAAQAEAAGGDHEAAISAAKEEGAREARAALALEHNKTLATVELRALAARRLIDPDDAPRFIDMATVIGTDGKFNPEAAGKALDDLVEKKPYVAQGQTPPPGSPPAPKGNGNRPAGSADQGPRPLGSTDPDAPMNSAIRAAANRK